jgi:hypothetical protein
VRRPDRLPATATATGRRKRWIELSDRTPLTAACMTGWLSVVHVGITKLVKLF